MSGGAIPVAGSVRLDCAESCISTGETVVEKHVFDLPRDARGVVLEVSFGKIVDTLDWLFIGRRTYALP